MILGYSRVSTAGQADDEATSLEEQQRKILAVAMARGVPEYEVAQFVDVITGSLALGQRPEGARLLRHARKGDVIVSTKLDRLFRSARDALVTVEGLSECGVHVVLTDISMEPITSNGVGKLFFNMLAAFAEFERERIVERMSDGRKAKVRRGGFIGGQPPYGWSYQGEGVSAVLVRNEAEQAVIDKIVALASPPTYLGPNAIAMLLNDQRVKPRSGGYWQATQICRIQTRLRKKAAEAESKPFEVKTGVIHGRSDYGASVL
jgi:putative DNA-invertase from lambdoid prophage Rac